MPWRLKYKERQTEWAVATYTTVYGLVLSSETASMTSPSFATLLQLLPEQAWAVLFITVGGVHMLALAVNGAGAWTPYARSVTASLNLLAYASIVAGIWAENPVSPGVPTYSFVCWLLIGILSRASRDCFVRLGYQNGAR